MVPPPDPRKRRRRPERWRRHCDHPAASARAEYRPRAARSWSPSSPRARRGDGIALTPLPRSGEAVRGIERRPSLDQGAACVEQVSERSARACCTVRLPPAVPSAGAGRRPRRRWRDPRHGVVDGLPARRPRRGPLQVPSAMVRPRRWPPAARRRTRERSRASASGCRSRRVGAPRGSCRRGGRPRRRPRVAVGGHGGRGVEVEAVGEEGQSVEQAALVVVEQRVAQSITAATTRADQPSRWMCPAAAGDRQGRRAGRRRRASRCAPQPARWRGACPRGAGKFGHRRGVGVAALRSRHGRGRAARPRRCRRCPLDRSGPVRIGSTRSPATPRRSRLVASTTAVGQRRGGDNERGRPVRAQPRRCRARGGCGRPAPSCTNRSSGSWGRSTTSRAAATAWTTSSGLTGTRSTKAPAGEHRRGRRGPRRRRAGSCPCHRVRAG